MVWSVFQMLSLKSPFFLLRPKLKEGGWIPAALLLLCLNLVLCIDALTKSSKAFFFLWMMIAFAFNISYTSLIRCSYQTDLSPFSRFHHELCLPLYLFNFLFLALDFLSFSFSFFLFGASVLWFLSS